LAVGSLKGPVRADNQDRAAVAFISRQPEKHNSLLVAVVCDGMGGMAEGGAAAALATSVFLAHLGQAINAPLQDRLAQAVESANLAVFNRWNGSGGTTLSSVVITPSGTVWAAHAGDSRIYRQAAEGLVLVTTDDTVQGVVHGHVGTEEEDRLDNRLLQFVGIGESLAPHIFDLGNAAEARWLLTTDGAHGLGKRLLNDIAAGARSPVDLVRKLVFVADAAGVHDNATVVSLSKRDFQAPFVFGSGLTLTIWTAGGRLDLWVADGPPVAKSVEIAKVDQRPEPPPAENDRVPNRGSKKAKAKKVVAKPAQPLDKVAAPLLNIVFGSDGPNKDD
jgi:serine/threonine protein phosphatase PrpC